MKKNKQEDPLVFALTTQTHLLKKIPEDNNGNIINSEFNAKTYTKKAYKAYLQGKSFFNYKGVTYVVPKMQKSKLDNYLEKDIQEDIPTDTISNEEKNINLW